jgi:hypothetical protein
MARKLRAPKRTLTIVEESVITHNDTFSMAGDRAPAVEFRVMITFQDELGRYWEIDKVFEAAPILSGKTEGRS